MPTAEALIDHDTDSHQFNYPYPEILTEEDNILRKTYSGHEEGPFHADIPYSASLDMRACSEAARKRNYLLLNDLQKRGLIVITQDDQSSLRWRFTLYGVEYVERAGIVAEDTVRYHRSARVALIDKFLGDRAFTKVLQGNRKMAYETFSPEVLAANIIFIYERGK